MAPGRLTDLLKQFQTRGPTRQALVDTFQREARILLPSDYCEFLQFTDGGEGFIGANYAMLWRIEDLLRFNRAYQTHEYAPGLLIFGSSGGGEAFAFDVRTDGMLAIVSVPFVGMDVKEAIPIAATFDEFLEYLANEVGQEKHSVEETIDDRNGMELFEIQPVVLGGDPIDPANKVYLTREQHLATVRYWNRIVRELRR